MNDSRLQEIPRVETPIREVSSPPVVLTTESVAAQASAELREKIASGMSAAEQSLMDITRHFPSTQHAELKRLIGQAVKAQAELFELRVQQLEILQSHDWAALPPGLVSLRIDTMNDAYMKLGSRATDSWKTLIDTVSKTLVNNRDQQLKKADKTQKPEILSAFEAARESIAEANLRAQSAYNDILSAVRNPYNRLESTICERFCPIERDEATLKYLNRFQRPDEVIWQLALSFRESFASKAASLGNSGTSAVGSTGTRSNGGMGNSRSGSSAHEEVVRARLEASFEFFDRLFEELGATFERHDFSRAEQIIVRQTIDHGISLAAQLSCAEQPSSTQRRLAERHYLDAVTQTTSLLSSEKREALGPIFSVQAAAIGLFDRAGNGRKA